MGDGILGRREMLNRKTFMIDLIFMGIVVVFFIVSGAYVHFCEKR
jgi:hypothetical protein